jgi:hypothetical protein
VTTASCQTPAALAAEGGHAQAAHQKPTAGVTRTGDGRTQVFSRTETDLHTGQVSVFEFVDVYDRRGNLMHERRTTSVDGHVVDSEESAFSYGKADRLRKVVIVTAPTARAQCPRPSGWTS